MKKVLVRNSHNISKRCALNFAIYLASICDCCTMKAIVLKKNAIESHESRSDLTIERAPMRLDGRRSSDHAFHCIIAFSSQTGYIYTARIRQFLFGHC